MKVKYPDVKSDNEAFYFIIDHLKKQNAQAINPERSEGCQYRILDVYDTLKCAVGSLIDDSEYGPDLEDQIIEMGGVVYHAVADSNPDWHIGEDSVDMLVAMQRLHDEVRVKNWFWLFLVIEMAIEEFGFENVVYAQGYSRSALYAMVTMAQGYVTPNDNRVKEWNFSEVTLDWFNNKKALPHIERLV
jgi:hypothetical protein